MFLVHDGRGHGHLRRACRLADAVSHIGSGLIVTGNEAVAGLAPSSIDYVKLPNIGRMNRDIGRQWSMSQFIELDRAELSQFRQTIVRGITDAFDPDIVIVDHLPLGKMAEWSYPVREHSSQKMLVLRPVLGTADRTRSDILGEGGLDALQRHFDRILVAGDRASSTVLDELQACDIVRSKTNYLGYVAPSLCDEDRIVARRKRGVPPNGKWIVCSGGSGHRAEMLLSVCVALSDIHCEHAFDIALGSRMAHALAQSDGRVRVTPDMRQLDIAHGSADLVICHGGYNTLMEALAGPAAVIVVPTSDRDDGHSRHATILAGGHPITLCASIAEVPAIVQAQLDAARPRQNGALSDGRSRFAEIIGGYFAANGVACSA